MKSLFAIAASCRGIALFAVLVGAAPACLADGPWSANLAVTTDYVLRGVSQSYGGAALQGGVNYQSRSGWFAGAWASNVDPYPFYSNAAEVNLYTGYDWSLGRDWSARASVTHYAYALDRRRRPYDYDELSMTLGFQDRLAATVSYQPNAIRYATLGYRRNKPAMAYELTGRWPLRWNLAVTGGVGYYDLTHLYDLGYWSGSAGLSYTRGRFELSATRFFSDATVRRLFDEGTADGRWVASAVWRF
jgi:uncharacterized protein (TIGR02001 family)